VFDETIAVITAVGAIATAVAVGVGVYQLRLAKQLAQAAFEDELTREYRAVVAKLPVEAFYSDPDSELTPTPEDSRSFLAYVNLSNQQLWLAKQGRIGEETARHWRQAIRANLGLPAFRHAWDEIADSVPKVFFGTLRDEVKAVELEAERAAAEP
jgi:hypothetical protein